VAIKANLDIGQESTFQTTINVIDDNDATVDLTGYTGVNTFWPI